MTIRFAAGRIAALCCLPLLAACGTGGWFGAEEDPPLPGTRISVLQLADAIEPDPLVADLDVFIPQAERNGDWPQAGMRANHLPGNLALSHPFDQAWSVDAGDGSSSNRRLINPPVMANGRVFAMDASGRVAAFDAQSGRRAWRVRATGDGEESDPLGGGLAFGDGRLYATTGFGEVLALNPSDGALLWRAEANGPIRSAPAFSAGRVFVISIDNQLEALDAATGQILWSHTGILEDAALLGGASPAAGGGVVIAPYSSGELFALRIETGRPAWSDSLAAVRRFGALAGLADIRAEPVIADNMVIAVSHSGRMVGIDLRSGARLWEQEVGGINMPLVAGEFIFMITTNSELVAMTKRGGRILWATPLQRFRDPDDREGPIVWAGPVLAGDRLITVGSNGEGVVASPVSGEIVHSFSLRGDGTIAPIVADGTLYVLSDNATLTAYR